jgi:protein-S-isoprenylcysteine O-methyltransferase Ste14
MLGFGIMNNALFVIVTTFISFFISKFVFIDRQERILADKYGAPYLEYKKAVKF